MPAIKPPQLPLKAELFFPLDEENRIIEPPCIIKCHHDGTDYDKMTEEYSKLPTVFRKNRCYSTTTYLNCIIDNFYALTFYRDNRVIVNCNFKLRKEVSTIQDLIDYGVNIDNI